jgi:hypothetical protein
MAKQPPQPEPLPDPHRHPPDPLADPKIVQPPPQPHEHPPHGAHRAGGGKKFVVSFPGLPPHEVEAADKEGAAKAAAQALGVILERCERPPEVAEVHHE